MFPLWWVDSNVLWKRDLFFIFSLLLAWYSRGKEHIQQGEHPIANGSFWAALRSTAFRWVNFSLRQTEKEKMRSSFLISGPDPFFQPVMILYRGWPVKTFSRGSHLGPRGWSPSQHVWALARHLKKLVMLPQPRTGSPRAPLTLDPESLSQWFIRKPKVWQLEKCKLSALRICKLTVLPEVNHSTGVGLSTWTSFYWAQTQWNTDLFLWHKVLQDKINFPTTEKGRGSCPWREKEI